MNEWDRHIKFKIEHGSPAMNDLSDKAQMLQKGWMLNTKIITICRRLTLKRKEKNAMNDKAKGKLNQTKGAIKTKIGNLTDNDKLKSEGIVDTTVGKTQEISGNIKKSVADTKKKLKK